jgi:hypothetical protein
MVTSGVSAPYSMRYRLWGFTTAAATAGCSVLVGSGIFLKAKAIKAEHRASTALP